MKLLSTITPAEALLILKGRKASLPKLLKITLMDLLLKQVLESKNVLKENGKRYKYIHTGKHFSLHNCSEHELIYLEPFLKNNSLKVLTRHLLEVSRKKAKDESKYQLLILKSTRIHALFKQNMFQLLFGGFSLTEKGLSLRTKLEEEIQVLGRELPSLIAFDPEKTNHILSTIGGSVFLLPALDFTIITQIDQQLLMQMTPIKKQVNSDAGCSSGCTSYAAHSGYFDSGDSGCSASGCSGCGGGCGGD